MIPDVTADRYDDQDHLENCQEYQQVQGDDLKELEHIVFPHSRQDNEVAQPALLLELRGLATLRCHADPRFVGSAPIEASGLRVHAVPIAQRRVEASVHQLVHMRQLLGREVVAVAADLAATNLACVRVAIPSSGDTASGEVP